MPPIALSRSVVYVDGLNQLIPIEVALAGGLMVRGHDGALRDLASVHGSYRLLTETPRALTALGTFLARIQVAAVHVILDAQVSNTGRLAHCMRQLAATHAWPWQVIVSPQTDMLLKQIAGVVATSDSAILDVAVSWCDLAAAVIAQHVPQAWYLDLDVPPPTV